MKNWIIRTVFVAALALLPAVAFGQQAGTSLAIPVASCGAQNLPLGIPYPLTQDQTGTLCTAAVTQLPSFSGTPTQSSVTVGTSSAQLIAASTFTIFAKVCVAQSATTGIWVNWSGAAAVQAAPSEYIPPGQCDSWVAATGYLPTSQVNAIASASVAATIIGK